ncbi:MAG TPA: DUF1501 domain-containing protein [Pirellulales bacterium]|nr:DUF1501 domain-containing protein [Pirellulales bacterium]
MARLSKEPDHLLADYGHKAGKYPHQTVKNIMYDWDARPFLLARRLVEAGVRVVTLRDGEWDHHGGPQSDIFAALKMKMALLDRSLCALLDDLRNRGLDQDVLVVVLGEFGRSPKIEAGPGRNHWAEAGCVLFAGGGLRMGQVVGETDSWAGSGWCRTGRWSAGETAHRPRPLRRPSLRRIRHCPGASRRTGPPDRGFPSRQR